MTELSKLLSERFGELGVIEVIQLLLISCLLFFFYRFLHRRRAFSILLGSLGVYIIHLIAKYAGLTIIHGFTDLFVRNGAFILVLLFHPEIRSTLERIGTVFSRHKLPRNAPEVVTALRTALMDMSDTKTGAIIFFERKTKLDDVAKAGRKVDALITAETLLTIFFSGTPLHDGAVMIRDGRIHSASCFIRGDSSSKLPPQYGSRHQAAFNLSLSSDAITVVVSEEDGSISYTERGELFHNITVGELTRVLYRALGFKHPVDDGNDGYTPPPSYSFEAEMPQKEAGSSDNSEAESAEKSNVQ
ncbi:MAG: diadenylate cyclase [Clostridia bacterium]|nr:diadenylate cyclase [Clostridia bacterium]